MSEEGAKGTGRGPNVTDRSEGWNLGKKERRLDVNKEKDGRDGEKDMYDMTLCVTDSRATTAGGGDAGPA